MYSNTTELEKVNEAQQMLFSKGKRSVESISPTQGALLQHIYRTIYQAGYIWGHTYWCLNSSYLHHLTGVGKKLNMAGCQNGKLYQKSIRLAMNYCIMAAKHLVRDTAGVIKQS